MQYRPEIRSQSYRIDVKQNGIDQAKSAFGPKVLATGKVGRRDTEFFPGDTKWPIGGGSNCSIMQRISRYCKLSKGSRGVLSRISRV